ncbi:MAG: Nif3-like dinuclear metal center hexameric protein [Flavobacteriales bacterium]|nr:Nif3-like dinuclear metal center hexameric protein [Flavobacteriales bacterium]
MKIREITDFLEEIAPLHYQEIYDNSGLIIGDLENKVNDVLITLDCTEEVIDEAISKNCNLIISHHPIIFTPLKKINGKSYVERVIIKAIRNDISIYAIHTNLDNVYNGVNSKIAEKLGLKNCKILRPKSKLIKQLVVYCPSLYSESLKQSLLECGAGEFKNYDNCSFSVVGKGTFRPKEGSNPFFGNIGKTETVPEERLELFYDIKNENVLLECLFKNHPYEQVAYQIYSLDNICLEIGSGMIGEVEDEIECDKFLALIKKKMKTDCIRHTTLNSNKIKRVAVCGGSGSFLLEEAKKKNADIFISSDFKYHEFFDADGKIIIADIGHFESEQFTKELIYEMLSKKFTKFAVQLSKVNTNPINYL